MLGQPVKGKLARPLLPSSPFMSAGLGERPTREACRALRALIASRRVPFLLGLRGSCFISEGRRQFSPTVLICSVHQRSAPMLRGDCNRVQSPAGWVQCWSLMLPEHLRCARFGHKDTMRPIYR